MSKISSFENGCKVMNYNPADIIPDVSKMPEHLQKFTTDLIELKVINEAMNKGKEFDWSDYSQRKWWAIMVWNASRSCFVYSDTGYTYTNTYLGSPFCFHTEADAKYFGETYGDKHNNIAGIAQ